MTPIDQHLCLTRTGFSRTEKAWISPSGDFIRLNGLWHYQWALQNRDIHGVDLADETDEQPIRLRMVAADWWRVNFEVRPCRLVLEGNASGISKTVVDLICWVIAANFRMTNVLDINVLNSSTAQTLSVPVHALEVAEVTERVLQFLG